MDYTDCDEYYDGRAAFYRGIPLSDSPDCGQPESTKDLAWRDGWLDAKWEWEEDDDL